ncbi:adenylate/guanylate cyclase domain-containing protein [Flammeovirga sp. MY04]|uniref:adenylate/guanylate cyclase domain-containing protein n=1 Tax=Flammeovirga sp. MY04 TaxID=1191459 RepID=UPI0008060883|nr:adenylate/guanylate cyclase domain-containing protein [Flammeovirga sp. MY04]ANQ48098.1 adenylate/guanylate cyclase domain-containing protein [Flammeovirga sp. MY04]
MINEVTDPKFEVKKFHQITQGAYLVGLLGHISAIFLFWYIGITELVFFNILFSCPAFASALYLNNNKHENYAFFLACVELLFHQVLCTYFLGWGFGAHFWLIYLAGLSFFNPNWNRKVQFGLLILICMVYVTISIVFKHGIYTLDTDMLHFSYISNAVFTIIITSLLINFYAQSTKRLEHNLRQEQKVTKRLLEKIRGLFGQQISQKIAQHMISSEEEIKTTNFDASIMFLDIRDFTVFADSRAPSEVAKFQNIVFGELIEIIRKNNGVVLQLLGDGLMAVFGAPIKYDGHEKDAVKSGFEILQCINQLVEEEKIPEIKIGIGLHSGNIVAGNIGNDERKAYSLTGKNVIIAARIESLNKTYNNQFLISENIFDRMEKSEVDIEEIGDVKLKGMETPTKIFKLA